jgi:LAS superfamily LD-carboxypeptidase LdcB
MGVMQAQEKYSTKALTGRGELLLSETEIKLQPEVQSAFEAMANAALKDSITIKIVSGYRSFDRQTEIWNKKFNANLEMGLSPKMAIEKIIEYSTIPGTSRHHWGTDIDIYDEGVALPKDLLYEKHYNSGGVFNRLKTWMDKHANEFGFYLVYPDLKDRTGFRYEPWHYSYKKIAKPMLDEFDRISLDDILLNLTIEGSDEITLEFLKNYKKSHVLGINSILK